MRSWSAKFSPCFPRSGEKFFLETSFHLRVTGDMEKMQQTCDLWAQTYPRDGDSHAFLSTIYEVTGKYEKEIEEAKKAIDLEPDFSIPYGNLAAAYESLDRLDEAENTLQRASGRKLEFLDFPVIRFDIAFLKADKPGMERELALGKRDSSGGDLSDNEAFALAYSGRLQQARRFSRSAVDLALQSGQREKAALYEAPAALWEAFFGNAAEARRRAMAALERSKDREVEYGAALALALSGDSSGAQTVANDLQKRFGEDTSVRFAYLPELRALLALNHGAPVKAIDSLQIAGPYELGKPRSKIHGLFGALYRIYVRGLVYVAAHRGAEAAGEFQKILDHRGIVVSDPIGALAHLQLGRAFASSGDTAKAKGAYGDFVSLWKEADPDIPIFKQAKAEKAKLQR